MRRGSVRSLTADEARSNAWEMLVFIRELDLSDVEMVELFAISMLHAAGEISDDEVYEQATALAREAVRRQGDG